jgi:hypothetical protein
MDNIALFLDEQLNQIGTKKFNSFDDFITYKKGTFNIRLNAFLYRNRNTTYYAYIYPTDEKLLIDVKIEPIEDKKGLKTEFVSGRIVKIKEKLEKGDLKLIVGESIIGQLARMAVYGLKQNWVLIIIIAVAFGLAGGGIGYGIGVSTHPSTAINLPSITPSPTPFNLPTVHP